MALPSDSRSKHVPDIHVTDAPPVPGFRCRAGQKEGSGLMIDSSVILSISIERNDECLSLLLLFFLPRVLCQAAPRHLLLLI